MTIQHAIESAIKSGYKFRNDSLIFDENHGCWYVSNGDGGYVLPAIEAVLLDPSFWQCLGKNEGWNDLNYYQAESFKKMQEMVRSLWEGKSIESFFETL